jgi:hypothetical protein
MRRRAAIQGDYNFSDRFGGLSAVGGSVGDVHRDQSGLSQEQALAELARLCAEDTVDPKIRRAAIKIIRDCQARDDVCELTALYQAVKFGDSQVKGLEQGLKYVSDPIYRDFYVQPSKLINDCEGGACAGDCDDHAMLIGALAGSLGFVVGLRAYKRKGATSYEHVYAVAVLPKVGKPEAIFGLDTSADAGPTPAGWEPPEGEVANAWLPGEVE